MADAKIALINTALEISKTETDAKINISNPQQMKSFLNEESNMLERMVDKVVGSGASVVFCQKELMICLNTIYQRQAYLPLEE